MNNTTNHNFEITITTHNHINNTSSTITYNPVIAVADNGIWAISNHEAFKASIAADQFSDWLSQAWLAIGQGHNQF